MGSKNLAYYLGLNYEVIVKKLESDGETVYRATTKELDPLTFYGSGDTAAECIENFEEVKRDIFPYYLEHGIPIAEPREELDEMPSGRFLVRTAPLVHRNLIQLAGASKLSLNQYVNYVLVSATTSEQVIDIAAKRIESLFVERQSNSPGDVFEWSTSNVKTEITLVHKKKNPYSEVV